MPLALLAACHAGCAVQNGRDLAKAARQKDFQETVFKTESFDLYGLLRPGKGRVLHVYIEGDGRAWLSRSRPSADPTPQNACSLKLAMNDASGAPVLYLARPCQYIGAGEGLCRHSRWWTDARFAPEVIASLSQAADQAKAMAGTSRTALAGWSGGGACAVLLAARRSDAVSVATFAGMLDAGAWTRHHGVSPLAASLDPLSAAAPLSTLAQLHLSGAEDSIVPPFVSRNFCARTGQPLACRTLPGMRHGGPWEEAWDGGFPLQAAD